MENRWYENVEARFKMKGLKDTELLIKTEALIENIIYYYTSIVYQTRARFHNTNI